MDWKNPTAQALKLFNYLEENSVDQELQNLLVETIKLLEDTAELLYQTTIKNSIEN